MAAPLPLPVTGLRATFREVLKTYTGKIGAAMLVFLLALVLVLPFVAPYDVAQQWGNRQPWLDNPRNAAPEWTGLFSGQILPRTVIATPCHRANALPLSTETKREACPGGPWSKLAVRTSVFGDFVFITMRTKFVFQADVFPSEMSLTVWAAYGQNAPLFKVVWLRPDGRNYTIIQGDAPENRVPFSNVYALSTDPAIQQEVRTWAVTNFNATTVNRIRPEVTLFAQAGESMLDGTKALPLKGEYTLVVEMVGSGTSLGMDAKAVLYGTVFGLAGTDSSRRDLLVGMLWGAPVALAFGSMAAVVIVLLQTILGALATWYGGFWDELIQRASDVLLILPLLPILFLIGIVYRPSIWVILLVLIAFGVVGSTTKVSRSIVLQVKEEAYIEAASSYGASRGRILFKHILPRLLPYTFALIALSVPAFIFLEASLSFLGIGDPRVPTWGSILGEASAGSAAIRGFWWWITFPASAIVFVTVAFAFLGYSFDKVLNPRLREQ